MAAPFLLRRPLTGRAGGVILPVRLDGERHSLNTETDRQSLPDKQKRFAHAYALFLLLLVAVGDGVMLWPLWVIAVRIQHRHQPLLPPPLFVLALFYLLSIAGLVGSVLWARSHLTGGLLQDRPREFIRQTQISLTLSSLCFYTAPVWVFLGGAFSQAAPLLLAQAGVCLLYLLPTLRRHGPPLRESAN